MNHHDQQINNRRRFLTTSSLGIGSLALNYLFHQDKARGQDVTVRPELGSERTFDLTPKPPQNPPKAKAMISLWMQGGPSHIDLFDPKPALAKLDGKSFEGEIKFDNAAQASSKILASPWKFQPHGQSGTELSELLPHTAKIVDDICLIRSMHTGVNNHGQSIRALQTGKVLPGRATLGSWLVYGLGAETQELPAYIALNDPGQLPVLGVENWSNGFLPSIFQGTVVRSNEPRILNLTSPDRISGASQKNYLSFLEQINKSHLENHPGEHDLQARIASYELAAKMQTSAASALNINEESEATKDLYGINDPETREYGTRCLIARRLIERGVRFVSVFTQNQFWDHHGRIRSALPKACKKVDQPSAALVQDLKQRGLLDSTVVQWGGEMGRLPVIQNDVGADKVGRDHNTHGFSMWLAGGGFKGGTVFGETDEFGHKAVQDVVNHYDYHETLLHLFGLDSQKLIYQQGNQARTLSDGQAARIVKEILA